MSVGKVPIFASLLITCAGAAFNVAAQKICISTYPVSPGLSAKLLAKRNKKQRSAVAAAIAISGLAPFHYK